MALDKRRVQTAVIGHADSELPVVLPMEAIELDEFRARHAGQTFWCGVWLGGCGHQLVNKLYTDRACHFAHAPDPEHTSTCSRKASGVSSADHLYVKHGLLSWLAEQDITATASIPRDADGSIGGEVLFVPVGHGRLRILLAEPTGSGAPAQEEPAHLVLGPEVASDPDVLLRQGYVNRIQLVSEGTRRRIQVGTERHGGTTEWFDLHEVGLTDTGLTTPAVEEIRRLRATRRPIGVRAPKAAPPQSRPAVRVTSDEAHGVPTHDRAAVMAALEQAVRVRDGRSRTEIRRWLSRAEEVTHSGATAKENGLIREAADALLRQERAVGLPTPRKPTPQERKAVEQVERLLGALERQKGRGVRTIVPRDRRRLKQAAKQASAWLTVEQRSQVQAWQVAPTASVPMPRDPRLPMPGRVGRTPSAAARSERFDAAGLAEAVRDVLEHAARLRKTVTFAELCAQVKGLGELTESEQVQVFRRLKPTAQPRSPKPHRPALLTALITTDAGTMHPIYRRLADHTGHHLPQQADNVWTDTVKVLHDRYGSL
ncbi:hypothetical protein V1J52_24550 [Streptomyces sp. TRM 70351]|uniref:hypothetical protein n=1 Tax=Streptomyces sp. TRM 70351 TaxID=3116552 RepID=UPI002E7B29E6|nr:hypothetical protein [Streptomyces sp. TRM 70351]MEE1931302.1 hypothetical protein [Streptomyces sp. TRM 70351]